MNQVNQNKTVQVDSTLDNGSKDNMSLTDQEALSALMDGELSEFEIRRLLTKIADSPELLATWERYNLARAVFEPEPLDLHSFSQSLRSGTSNRLLSQIMFAVEQEPQASKSSIDLMASGKSSVKTWHRDLARLAIAASVALAVFVGMQSQITSSNPTEIAATASSTQHQNVQVAVDEEAQQRLNDYIRSVSIPGRADSPAPFNILEESAMLRPVSDRELIEEVERKTP